jgi:hypothetical protein
MPVAVWLWNVGELERTSIDRHRSRTRPGERKVFVPAGLWTQLQRRIIVLRAIG